MRKLSKTFFLWYFAADQLLIFVNSHRKGLCSQKRFLISKVSFPPLTHVAIFFFLKINPTATSSTLKIINNTFKSATYQTQTLNLNLPFNNQIFIYVNSMVGGCFIGFTYCIYCHKIHTHFNNVSGSLRNNVNKANYLHVHVFVELCCKMAWHFSTSIIISVIFR